MLTDNALTLFVRMDNIVYPRQHRIPNIMKQIIFVVLKGRHSHV